MCKTRAVFFFCFIAVRVSVNIWGMWVLRFPSVFITPRVTSSGDIIIYRGNCHACMVFSKKMIDDFYVPKWLLLYDFFGERWWWLTNIQGVPFKIIALKSFECSDSTYWTNFYRRLVQLWQTHTCIAMFVSVFYITTKPQSLHQRF